MGDSPPEANLKALGPVGSHCQCTKNRHEWLVCQLHGVIIRNQGILVCTYLELIAFLLGEQVEQRRRKENRVQQIRECTRDVQNLMYGFRVM